MGTSLKMSTALSAVVGVPVTICLYPPAAIPIGVGVLIAAAIVVWHLRLGGRAVVRRSPKGTLSFVLDSPQRRRVPGRRA